MGEHEHEDEKGTKGFKVVDRRRFTSEGETRDDAPLEDRPRAAPPPAEPAPAPAPRREPEASAPPSAAPTEPADYSIDFISFAASLATNALAALGALPEQAGRGMPQNPELARDYIDILAMLEDKTRGNLTAEEASGLRRLITELRLTYVEMSQGKRR